ncbi:molybdate-anion transporter-like [Liolophura sinensis]|uniref:molybdate-anion transporter-like n=1 Tax=Liolophura sinensis TaxID=3198878 RepID=UPI003158AAFC
MLILTYITLGVLTGIAVALQLWARRNRQEAQVGNNPQFLKFQRGYFVVYLMAMFADWLQGPYLYKLYSYYGFQEDQIATLYVFGFASTVLLGTWAPVAADKFGRKKLCIAFTVLYSVSCFLKLSRSYGILLIGRLLGGMATSVLFSAFEAWYVHEHVETHDFPKEWIAVTFTKASMWNGVLATVAGLTSSLASEWFGLGPVAPYMMAVPFLIFVGIVIYSHWNENYSGHKTKFSKLCIAGLSNIGKSERIFVIGVIEALFESVIYVTIFLWTPILEPGMPPLGIVFSCFMVCILIGSAVFQILSMYHFAVQNLLLVSTAIALVANVILVISVHPDKQSFNMSFGAYLLLELAVGMYFPAMGFLRSRVLPETHRSVIMNWFRVPISIIACIVLMLLHEDVFQHGNRWIFAICVGLLSLACVSCWRFIHLSKNSDDLRQDTVLMELEHYHNIF